MNDASRPTRSISLPPLETLLARDDVQANPADAATILTYFTFFSSWIADQAYNSATDATLDAMAFWQSLTECDGLTANVRQLLSSAEMLECIRIVWNETETERSNGIQGQDLTGRAASLVIEQVFEQRLIHVNDTYMDGYRETLHHIRVFLLTHDPQPHMETRAIDLDDISTPCAQAPANGCPICIGGTVGLVTLNVCSHVFCCECLEEWVGGKGEGATTGCPCCRAELNGTG